VAHDTLRDAVAVALGEMGVDDPEIHFERPRDPSHGDWATNVAMTLARTLKRPPRQIAEEIRDRLDVGAAGVTSVEVAGPGFLNFRLSAGSVAGSLEEVLAADEGYGRADAGRGERIMVEWVSANPTGPLHLGHGRQAALGDAICRLLEATGWTVHREFYYNDSGRQMERLAASVWARYQQELGRDVPVPEDGYRGEYIAELARDFRAEHGDALAGDESPEAMERLRHFAVAALRAEQDRDLNAFRVGFDNHYLESSLYEEGRVADTVARLRETGLVYEREGATWLKTTEFGDDKDRVMLRSNGMATYFLPDVAYHLTKWERGYHTAINVQGSDHHGTVARVRAGLQALGLPRGYPEYVLHQMVRVERDGQEVKFSKRAGSYTTLRELVDEVGVDVTRWFFLMRTPQAHLVFDLDLATEESDKNPVYKVQYAHARMHSIFERAGVEPSGIDAGSADLSLLSHELERELIKQLDAFPELVARAAEQRAPHLVCDYLEQTAGAVNTWYHAGNPSRNPELAVLTEDAALRTARLVLARAVQVVLRNGLQLLGLEAPSHMARSEDEASATGA
jgi:arginyl-tRNA synthetase